MSATPVAAPQVQILNGDCLAALELIPSESIDCVVTSPPYWGLRDYGTARWDGGDPNCDHRSPTMREDRNENRAKLAGSAATNSDQLILAHKSGCGKCGAVKVDAQIGLEPSLAEHMAALVGVFREIRRVLKKTGTCWVNYGDAYACAPNGRSAADTKAAGNDDRTFRDKPLNTVQGALKAKDRMMLPARLAIALCEDGWWLRDEVIWSKPNPMPSSVKDRTTPAHEMIYLFTKAPRYFFDQEAWAEPSVIADRPSKKRGEFNGKTEAMPSRNAFRAVTPTRNKRSVWTVPPKPFKGAHFATFPPALIEPCVLAGCPEQVCVKCGAPWTRLTERVDRGWEGAKYGERAVAASGGAISGGTAKSTLGSSNGKLVGQQVTLGFQPTCECAAGTKPGTVLDPFGGAGTTALVARQHGRDSILIELNSEYVGIARRRLGLDFGASTVSDVTTDSNQLPTEGIFA